jgi:hypothetical protein
VHYNPKSLPKDLKVTASVSFIDNNTSFINLKTLQSKGYDASGANDEEVRPQRERSACACGCVAHIATLNRSAPTPVSTENLNCLSMAEGILCLGRVDGYDSGGTRAAFHSKRSERRVGRNLQVWGG